MPYSLTTLARTMRAICGTYRMPIARMSEGSELPNTTTNVAASAMPGNDMSTSRMRMMTSDTHLRVTAAMAPMIEPRISANAVAPRPMTSE